LKGHPIFKWFEKGSTEPSKFYFVHYAGRMGNTLLKLVGERVDGFKKELAAEKNYITTLAHSDFDAFVAGSAAVVYMYTPWSERDVKGPFTEMNTKN